MPLWPDGYTDTPDHHRRISIGGRLWHRICIKYKKIKLATTLRSQDLKNNSDEKFDLISLRKLYCKALFIWNFVQVSSPRYSLGQRSAGAVPASAAWKSAVSVISVNRNYTYKCPVLTIPIKNQTPTFIPLYSI
jgi:hypothetical protein